MRGQYYLHLLEVTGLAGPGPAADSAEAAVCPLEAAVPPHQLLLLPVLQLLQDLQPGSQSQLSIAPAPPITGQYYLSTMSTRLSLLTMRPSFRCSKWSELVTADRLPTNHSSVLCCDQSQLSIAVFLTNESPVLPEAGQQLVAGVPPLLCVPRPRPAP